MIRRCPPHAGLSHPVHLRYGLYAFFRRTCATTRVRGPIPGWQAMNDSDVMTVVTTVSDVQTARRVASVLVRERWPRA